MSTIATLIKNDNRNPYIHGYSANEQDRLIRQSNFLASYIYRYVDFSDCYHIIEVGCGVGAQIQQLLNRWPHLKITGVDISAVQIARARELLKPYIDAGQVSLYVSYGEELPFHDESFDGALICFVLEHANHPINILKELKRVMRSGSSLYCTEAFNTGLYVYPTCQALQSYWEIFNRQQNNFKGDTNIGLKLCNLASKVNFSEILLNHVSIVLDDRIKEPVQRANLIDWFLEALLSASPDLMAQKQVTLDLLEEMAQELNFLKYTQESIFLYPFQQMKAVK
ncbi:class I SAM-dependent methyltransferase [Scytonema sp. NUACC21]